jgi:hypothetical protein
MGSLILLLLVIDKRAKAVARAKAVQEYAERKKTTAEEEKARQEEWEQQVRNLHALLRQQLDDVRGQADAVQGKINAAVSDANGNALKNQKLQNQLEDQKSRYAKIVGAIATKKSELAEASKNDAASEAQRRQMTADLILLENTLEELKAAKRLEKQTFSLVPYKGRRGDNRKPLYLECTAEGWIIHPERKTFEATSSAVADLHAELERRLKASATAGESSSYLFLLVRPDGITNYYRAQAAMQGLDVTFGYEFVDAVWVLDFTENGEKPVEPWMNVRSSPGLIATSPGKGVSRKAAPATPPIWYAQGTEGASAGTSQASQPGGSVNNGNEKGHRSTFHVTSGSAVPGLGHGGPGADPGRGVGHGGPGADPDRGVGHGGPGVDPGRSVGQGPGGDRVGVREFAAGPPFRSGVPGGGLGTIDGMPGSPPEEIGEGGIGPQGVGLATPRPTSGSGESGILGHGPSGSGSTEGNTARGDDPGATRTENPSPSGDPSSPGNGTQAGKGDSSLTRPSTDAKGGPPRGSSRVPYPGDTADPSAKPAAKTDGTGGSADPSTARKADQGGLEGPSFPRKPSGGNADEEPGERPTPGLDGPSLPRANRGSAGSGTTDKPKPFRLTGNRDWNIPVVCTSEGLALPGGLKITASALATTDGGKALVKAVQELIARKQATVRDGEPAYRPQVRFLVHPEGLRVYHTAYPILEPLQVPILRQNVEPEDPNQPAPGGRQP